MKNKFPSVRTLNEQKRIKETWNRWGGSDRKFSFGQELAKRVRLRVCSWSKRSFGFARLINPSGQVLRRHSGGACCVRGRGIFDVFLPTRLVTRTKESNIWTSLWVCKLVGILKEMYSNLLLYSTRSVKSAVLSDPYSYLDAMRNRDGVHLFGPERRRTMPGHGEVSGNADGGRFTMLTCKSLVWSRYRGERLIESPSSWFLPKFSLE